MFVCLPVCLFCNRSGGGGVVQTQTCVSRPHTHTHAFKNITEVLRCLIPCVRVPSPHFTGRVLCCTLRQNQWPLFALGEAVPVHSDTADIAIAPWIPDSAEGVALGRGLRAVQHVEAQRERQVRHHGEAVADRQPRQDAVGRRDHVSSRQHDDVEQVGDDS